MHHRMTRKFIGLAQLKISERSLRKATFWNVSAAQPQIGAIHQQVHRLAPIARPQHLQRLGPSAHCGVVRHCEVEAKQLQNGAILLHRPEKETEV